MNDLRRPAVAGTFYPNQPSQLRRMVQDFLEEAPVKLAAAPKALIAPHAGYVYSGPIAGTAFGPLAHAGSIKRVVLPQGQKSASFNIDQVLQKLQSGAAAGK